MSPSVPTHPLFTLDGEVALVTGAGSPGGIGFATALLLGQLGCSLAVAATGPRIEQRAQSLRDLGIEVSAHRADLRRPEEAGRLIDEVRQAHGRLDIVVNNAGMEQEGQPEAFTEVAALDPADWAAALARSLDSAFLVTRFALPHLLAQGAGSIVNVASVTGPVVATAGEAPYAAAKAGMVGLTRALALEIATTGVRVNAVAPGWVATDTQPLDEALASDASPMGRAARPEEVAAVIAFLAMPAASYVHGALVVVDGANHLVERLRP